MGNIFEEAREAQFAAHVARRAAEVAEQKAWEAALVANMAIMEALTTPTEESWQNFVHEVTALIPDAFDRAGIDPSHLPEGMTFNQGLWGSSLSWEGGRIEFNSRTFNGAPNVPTRDASVILPASEESHSSAVFSWKDEAGQEQVYAGPVTRIWNQGPVRD